MKTTAAYLVLMMALLLSGGDADAGFPAGKCTTRTCDASPYMLRWDADGAPCFTISAKPCRDGAGPACCAMFGASLYKVVLTSPLECRGTVVNVTVGGVAKAGGVYYDAYDTWGELRLTALRLSNATAVGTRICVHARAPCDTAARLCGPSCMFSVYDPNTHLCCPTCEMPTPAASSALPPAPRLFPPPPPPHHPIARASPAPRPPAPAPAPPALASPPHPPTRPVPAHTQPQTCSCNCTCAV